MKSPAGWLALIFFGAIIVYSFGPIILTAAMIVFIVFLLVGGGVRTYRRLTR